MNINKDVIINSLCKFWITEIELKKFAHSKRVFRSSIINVFWVKDDYVIVRYYSFLIIPKLVKIKLNDILSINSKFRRRRPINNIDFLRITSLKKCQERKKLVWKTNFLKLIAILLFIGMAVGVSILIAKLSQ